VEFDLKKTEAIVLARRRRDKAPKLAQRIRIGTNEICYNKEATRWLRVWIDGQLTFATHHNTMMTKALQAQARLKGLCKTQGLSPANAQKIQIACIQAVAFLGSEIWWKGQKNRLNEIQKMVN
jgi:hypothetical protein